MEEKNKKISAYINKVLKSEKDNFPFLVKAVALLIIVYGFINFVYYSIVFIYSFINPEFFKNLEYADFRSNWLLMPVSFKILLGGVYIIAGVLIFKKYKRGGVIFYFSYFISFFFSLVFLSNFNIVDFSFGIIAVITLFSFRNNINWK